jgi:hypothetical protein
MAKAGRPKLGRTRDKWLQIRCFADEKAQWAQKAGEAGLTEWVVAKLGDDCSPISQDNVELAATLLDGVADEIVLVIKRLRRDEGVTHAKQLEQKLVKAATAAAQAKDLLN